MFYVLIHRIITPNLIHSGFVNTNSNTIAGSKSELFILNEKKLLCEEQMSSVSFANTEVGTHTTSNNFTLDDLGEFSKQVGKQWNKVQYYIPPEVLFSRIRQNKIF